MSPLQAYFDEKPEPLKGTLMALRDIILNTDYRIHLAWKYRTAFFCIGNKNLCYLSVNTAGQLYVGFILGYRLTHPALQSEGRKQIKVYYQDSKIDINKEEIEEIISEALLYY